MKLSAECADHRGMLKIEENPADGISSVETLGDEGAFIL
jgi:hypothetical protein